MKICRYENTKSEWYKKIDWLKLIIIFIVVLSLSFAFLYYLSLGQDLENAIITSLFIALLIGIEIFLIDFLENKDRIFLIEDNKISYIEIHNQKDGKFLSDLEYKKILKNNSPENIIKNLKKFEGIDYGEIVKVNKISNRLNEIIVKVEVSGKVWKPYGKLTISDLKLEEKSCKRKLIISKDYTNFRELEKTFKKMLNK